MLLFTKLDIQQTIKYMKLIHIGIDDQVHCSLPDYLIVAFKRKDKLSVVTFGSPTRTGPIIFTVAITISIHCIRLGVRLHSGLGYRYHMLMLVEMNRQGIGSNPRRKQLYTANVTITSILVHRMDTYLQNKCT